MRDPEVGDRIDQYQLTELLARGGMASIFKAIDPESGAAVALKIPYLHYESDVVFFDRFRREEEIGQRLDHPGIVKVLKPREKSRMYLVMEYVPGRPLRALLGPQPLPAAQALEIAQQICEALAHMHAQGVVHRDLKPDNLLVTPDGRVKISDFGIASSKGARRLTWSGLSHSFGTPDYAAPEQIGGKRGDARTDVYALGTLLYEMLTGHVPWDAPNTHALLRAKTNDEPTRPSLYLHGFDPSLEAILLKAIAREPRDRYAGGPELLAALHDPAAAPVCLPAPSRSAAPRRVVSVVIAVGIIAGLASLIRLSGRAIATRSPPLGQSLRSTTAAPARSR
jgi:serine/threonine protein kinase